MSASRRTRLVLIRYLIITLTDFDVGCVCIEHPRRVATSLHADVFANAGGHARCGVLFQEENGYAQVE
jgi:hypothetical protein